MAIADYSPPVDQLLTQAPHDNLNDWSNYLNLGITLEHVPALIQMIGDESLYADETDDELYWAAPIHAWRTLAQLKAEAAIDALIDVIRQRGDDLNWNEWIIEEIPQVFGEIGGAALPALTNYLADTTQPLYCLETAISCIAKIGMQHPEQRESCIAILTHELEAYADRDPEFNGYLVTALAADLKAVEAAPVIEQAFAADKVDEAFIGDWDEAQVYLGLKTREEVPRKRFSPFFGEVPQSKTPAFESKPNGFGSRQANQKKAKRKQQKEARRKNRSKKK